MKHVLFKNKEEHWNWCHENYFRYYGNFNPSPWSDEDKKIMQPFFDYRKGKHAQMSPEVQAALEHYDKVRDKGVFARECIDVVQRIEESQLLEVFGFERKYESDFETDEEYEAYLDNEDPPELAIELSYPCIMVSSLSASFDRCGDVTEAFVDYVELSEFESVVGQLPSHITDKRIEETAKMARRLADREKPNLDEVDFGTPHLKEE